jgi:hypothetical protein
VIGVSAAIIVASGLPSAAAAERLHARHVDGGPVDHAALDGVFLTFDEVCDHFRGATASFMPRRGGGAVQEGILALDAQLLGGEVRTMCS